MYMEHELHNNSLRGLDRDSEGSPIRSGQEALDGLDEACLRIRASFGLRGRGARGRRRSWNPDALQGPTLERGSTKHGIGSLYSHPSSVLSPDVEKWRMRGGDDPPAPRGIPGQEESVSVSPDLAPALRSPSASDAENTSSLWDHRGGRVGIDRPEQQAIMDHMARSVREPLSLQPETLE